MNESFLEQLSKPRPDPGGGSAAAYGAALGLALLEKIARLEHGRDPRAIHQAHSWRQILAEISELSADFSRLLSSDVEAYKKFVKARRNGHEDQLLEAIENAINCPLEIMTKGRQALSLTRRAGALCMQHLVADLLVAVEFFGAALRGAHHIAIANLPLIKDNALRQMFQSQLSKELDYGRQFEGRALGELLSRVYQ